MAPSRAVASTTEINNGLAFHIDRSVIPKISSNHPDSVFIATYTMATLFEPSLSTSAMRPPLSTASAPSMVESLPSINFGFEELRQRMASFTDRFDAFIAEGRKRVLEERNQFRIGVAELQGMSLQSFQVRRSKIDTGTNILKRISVSGRKK